MGKKRQMKVSKVVTMSVYEHEGEHRISGDVDPENASVVGGLEFFNYFLQVMQERKILPGRKLEVIIRTVD